MKKPKRITLVLYGLCAVIWSLRVIIGVMYKDLLIKVKSQNKKIR